MGYGDPTHGRNRHLSHLVQDVSNSPSTARVRPRLDALWLPLAGENRPLVAIAKSSEPPRALPHLPIICSEAPALYKSNVSMKVPHRQANKFNCVNAPCSSVLRQTSWSPTPAAKRLVRHVLGVLEASIRGKMERAKSGILRLEEPPQQIDRPL